MATQRLTERFAFTGGKVDRTDPNRPVIRDVVLCGFESKNRRRYKGTSFGKASDKRYEGRNVFINHGRKNTEREYQERIAVVANERRDATGRPIGDLPVNPKHPYAEAFLWDAEHQPGSVGMSHVADCRTTTAADGWVEVEDVAEVESVDVVLNPATTKGLHESTRRSAVPQISLKTFVERFGPKWGAKKWGAAQKLVEDIGDVADAPVMDEPPADADTGDLKTALMSAITPMLDEAFESGDTNKVCAAIKDFIKLHSKHTGKDAGKSDAPADDAPADDDAAEESKRRPKGLAGYIAEAAGFGLKAPTTGQLAVLETIPTQAGRKLFCAEAVDRHSGAETPVSSGKRPGSGPAPKTDASGKPLVESVPTDAKSFAASIRE